MVPGPLRSTRPLIAVLPALLVLVLLVPADADAANRRVAIGDFRWSLPAVELDRGEHVTWHWVGPDTMHSITGVSDDAAGLDSDPDSSFPRHPIGDSFRLSFARAGSYSFQCKLHSLVRGTVDVSSKPGDPVFEPDPIPAINVDLEPPALSAVSLARTTLRRRGAALRFSLGEPARLEADYFRLRPRGKRRFAGWARWKGGHVGFNHVRFGTRRRHFKPRSGRYLAEIRAIDEAENETRPTRLRFRIARHGGRRR